MLTASLAGLLLCFLGNLFPDLDSCIFLPSSAIVLGIIGALAARIRNPHPSPLRSTLGASLLAWLSFSIYTLVIIRQTQVPSSRDGPLVCDAGFQAFLFCIFSTAASLIVIASALLTTFALKKIGKERTNSSR
jgi:hypothetical protein